MKVSVIYKTRFLRKAFFIDNTLKRVYHLLAESIYPTWWSYILSKPMIIFFVEAIYFTSSHVSVRNGKALNPKVLRRVIFPT